MVYFSTLLIYKDIHSIHNDSDFFKAFIRKRHLIFACYYKKNLYLQCKLV